MRRALVVPAAAAAVAGVLAFGAAPAAAHAALETSEPSSGARLDEAPADVVLRFNEPVEVGLGGVRVYDGDGARLDVGTADQPGDGREVRVALPDLDDGAYVVTWRVVSADTHPIQGAFVFSVGDAASPTDAQGLADRLLAAGGASGTVGFLYALARFAVYAGIAVLVGGVAFVAAFRPASFGDRRAARVVVGAGVVTAVATVAGIGLHGAYASGGAMGDVLDGALVRDVLDTRFGQAWGLRVAVLAVALALAVRLRRSGRPGPSWHALALATGAALVLTVVFAGHAVTGDHVPLAVVADTVHLAAMAVWLGGLVLLVTAVVRRPVAEDMPAVVRRFSTTALVAVLAIVASGGFQSWRQVGGLDALRETDYGRLLIAKLVLVGLLVVVAAASREAVQRFLRPRAPTDVEAALVPVGPGAARAEVEPDPDARATGARKLRTSVSVEVVFAALVLAVTALLVSAEPARTALRAPFAEVVQAEELWLDVLVTPARPGTNEVHLQALSTTGTLEDVIDMRLEVAERERGIAPIDVPLRRLGPGHYFAPGVEIPFAGEWTLDVAAYLTEVDLVRLEATVPVR